MIFATSLTFNVILFAWSLICLYRIEILKDHRRRQMEEITDLKAKLLKCEVKSSGL